MTQIGYLDIENDELQRYFDAVSKKVGVCDILPSGRFCLYEGNVVFDGLVCSDSLGVKQTGVGAESCQRCANEKTI